MAAPKNWTTLRSSGRKVLSVANTNRDGSTGTYVDIMTGVAAGTVVQRINIAATGTTTDGFVRVFVYDGTNAAFEFEIPVPARVPSVAVVASGLPAVLAWNYTWRGSITLANASYVLRMSTEKAETFHVTAEGVDY